MMKMDGRDSAECKNWEKKGQNGHFGNRLKIEKDKIINSVYLLHCKKGKQNVGGEKSTVAAEMVS